MSGLDDILGRQAYERHQGIVRPNVEALRPSDHHPIFKGVPETGRYEEGINKAEQIAKNMETYFNNPWAMVEDGHIWTLDEADKLNPVKQFPDQPWLKWVAGQWQESDLLALVKSRRMLISWEFIFLHLWAVMFLEGRSVFFVSDKEEKSDELIDRVEFIYNHIPDDVMLKPTAKRTYCHFEVPGLNNYILGVAQGARQLAQYTASFLFFDEFAHWERARETFMAAKPTIDGGGKVTLVSSPKEGFFKEICFDQVK
jgi:hypothetical protein